MCVGKMFFCDSELSYAFNLLFVCPNNIFFYICASENCPIELVSRWCSTNQEVLGYCNTK